MALVPRDILGDDFFAPFPVFRSGPLAPSSSSDALTRGIAIDVTEDNDKFEIKADLPGAKKDEISVTVHDDVLRLSVSKSTERKEDDPKKRWHRYERSQSWVDRSIRLPVSADLEKVKASYKDGVLDLTVPKKTASAGPEGRKVTVA